MAWHNCCVCGSRDSYCLAGALEANGGQAFAWLCIKCSKNGIPVLPKTDKAELEWQYAGFPKEFRSCSADQLYCDSLAKEHALAWVANSSSILVASGPTGTGKTYLACVLLKQFRKMSPASTVNYYSVSTARQQWKEAEDKGATLRYKLQHSDCLLMDDIGVVAPTDAFLEFLYDIINYRYSNGLKTIYTTNLTGIELREKMGNAICSRLTAKANCIVKLIGEDLRGLQF
jgi:DNA replication protein DnaC